MGLGAKSIEFDYSGVRHDLLHKCTLNRGQSNLITYESHVFRFGAKTIIASRSQYSQTFDYVSECNTKAPIQHGQQAITSFPQCQLLYCPVSCQHALIVLNTFSKRKVPSACIHNFIRLLAVLSYHYANKHSFYIRQMLIKSTLECHEHENVWAASRCGRRVLGKAHYEFHVPVRMCTKGSIASYD